MYSVKISGFKTKKQAAEFLNWYEGGGEQQFYDHLDILHMNPDDGCNINCDKNYVYDEENKCIEAEVK
jgi:hypothetical protein